MTRVRFLPEQWSLDRCPHCKIARPNLVSQWDDLEPPDSEKIRGQRRFWCAYRCSTCRSIILTCWSAQNITSKETARGPKSEFCDFYLNEIIPAIHEIAEEIPSPAREYLKDASNAVSSPNASIMAAASAVDAMLKHRGINEKNLYDALKKAVDTHIITQDMEKWGHHIRIEANDQRHVKGPLATVEQAQAVVDFAEALGEFLFVLPSRVTRGIKKADEASTGT